MAWGVHELLALLSVEHDFHRRWEIRCNIAKAPDAAAVLRGIRRHGPSRLRAAALDALMHLEGESGLDPKDVAAVERLIRIRQRNDVLTPVMSIETTWWCIRELDQATVMASLGLTSPRPVTYKLANSVMEIIDSDDESGLVYVGPEINGWAPVVGPWCDAFGDRAEEARSTVERLSADSGEVHAFSFSAYNNGTAWLVARNGVTIRRFSTFDPQDSTGDPLPIEQDWMSARGLPGRPEDHCRYNDHGVLVYVGEFADMMEDFYQANDVAAAVSVDVGWKHPHDALIHGSPVLAAVPDAGPVTLPPGMYEV
ncbi:hypothetical protein [Cryptosporangium arvum]|uniref:Uncharacterized protein n=1 Tax=Cryptosporangium arvum DSM 44712 TaxID=927661 RepID=A0A010ZTE1_9ACTN|nr:hypothetical protein [Cryptosporangium arvum]EXG80492.1 hypothetical protein CryarDRAFT_1568 [Cryptosporangium arvum DSM 44712]